MKVTILGIALCMSSPALAHAQSPDSFEALRAEIQELREELAAVRKQLDSLQGTANSQPQASTPAIAETSTWSSRARSSSRGMPPMRSVGAWRG